MMQRSMCFQLIAFYSIKNIYISGGKVSACCYKTNSNNKEVNKNWKSPFISPNQLPSTHLLLVCILPCHFLWMCTVIPVRVVDGIHVWEDFVFTLYINEVTMCIMDLFCCCFQPTIFWGPLHVCLPLSLSLSDFLIYRFGEHLCAHFQVFLSNRNLILSPLHFVISCSFSRGQLKCHLLDFQSR